MTKSSDLPFLFLHGWGTDARVWLEIGSMLQKNCDVYYFDLPGYGQCQRYSFAKLDDYLAHIAQLIPQRVNIVGWSLGGLVAMRYAERYPQYIANLVLVSSTPKFVQDVNWPHAIAKDEFDKFIAEYRAHPSDLIKRFAHLQAQGDRNEKFLFKNLQNLMSVSVCPTPAGLEALHYLRDTDYRQNIVKLSCPLHIIHGCQDQIVPIANIVWMIKLTKQVKVCSLVDAGHAPFLSFPRKFIKLLEMSTSFR